MDYNATTPISPEVVEAMLPFLYGNYGNPSSVHEMGKTAKTALEEARGQVANLLNCHPSEVIFTSGGSESNNMVIKGVAYTYKNKGNHIITSVIEHPAILKPLQYLESIGYKVSYVGVDQYGMVNPSDIERLITDETILVTVMHANNETGTIQSIKDIADICKKHDVFFHTDASQSVGKIPTDVNALGVDFLTIAGHKLYAPKGIGALYIREGIIIEPLIHGAGHESGKRAGTENVMFQVGLGKACELAAGSINDNRIQQLTDYFYGGICQLFGDKVTLNGHPQLRLPNTLNVSFLGFEGNAILNGLHDVAASTGSACHSGTTTLSPVISAMNVTEEVGRGAVRFSLGRMTSKEDVDEVLEKLQKMIGLIFNG